MTASIAQPRCPDCRWHLHFCDGSLLGRFEWLAYCWNPTCRRTVVGPEDARHLGAENAKGTR